jgi:hypothetical protein
MVRPLVTLLLLAAQVEDRALAGEPVGDQPASGDERVLEHLEHPPARRVGGVERARLDEALERPLVDLLRIDALAEVPDG